MIDVGNDVEAIGRLQCLLGGARWGDILSHSLIRPSLLPVSCPTDLQAKGQKSRRAKGQKTSSSTQQALICGFVKEISLGSWNRKETVLHRQ